MMFICCTSTISYFDEISHELFISLLGVLVMFMLIAGKDRIFNYIRFWKFNGLYFAQSTINQTEFENKTFTFKFAFLSNRILLEQLSEHKGNWCANFTIDAGSPFVIIGRYNYKESGNYSGDWGTMNLWLNNDKTEIVVESIPKNREGKGVSNYVLIKKN